MGFVGIVSTIYFGGGGDHCDSRRLVVLFIRIGSGWDFFPNQLREDDYIQILCEGIHDHLQGKFSDHADLHLDRVSFVLFPGSAF